MWKAIKWGTAGLAVALVIALSGVVGHTIGDDGGSSTVINRTVDNDDTSNPTGSRGYSILDEIETILQEDFVNPDAIDPASCAREPLMAFSPRLGTRILFISRPKTSPSA